MKTDKMNKKQPPAAIYENEIISAANLRRDKNEIKAAKKFMKEFPLYVRNHKNATIIKNILDDNRWPFSFNFLADAYTIAKLRGDL